MKFRNLTLTAVTSLLTLTSCSHQQPQQQTTDDDFALGADISWYTEYEQRGYPFYNQSGVQCDCPQAMKDCGITAVRLRVWVDPASRPRPSWIPADAAWQPDSWCDASDLLVKCQRAKELGLDIMIDFHYSDSWADPGHQPTPHAWEGHSVDEMCQDVARHTTDVLTLLREHDIAPRWVQIGNETSNGMMWPIGHARPDSCQNYARLFIAGYDALKSVFPDAIGIVHLDNGWNPDLYDWNLGGLKANGAKWDMVGMSLYPYWAHQSDSTREAEQTITDCIANIKRVGQLYECPVMITEVGFEVDETRPEVLAEGRRQLGRVLREARYATDGICRGVFYWEPECRPSQYRLGAYTEDGHPTVIMDAWREYDHEFAPGEVWTDTEGGFINAHGAGLLKVDDTWYLYGESKSGPTRLNDGLGWECYRTDVEGVNCYSSHDLLHWQYEGKALLAEPTDSTSDIYPTQVCERPKVIYNQKTGKYVMWMHIDSPDYSKAAVGVAVSDTPTGPFTYLSSFHPNGCMSRDQTLFVDDDGTAYQICSSEDNATLHINRLTDDYLQPDGTMTRACIGDSREAPALFKYQGRYYMLSSGCTGWDPNQARIAVADSIMGPWSYLPYNPCTGPNADITFYGQSTYVIPVDPTAGKFIACFDLWHKLDLKDSRYCWLPLTFDAEGKVTIPWCDQWQLSSF